MRLSWSIVVSAVLTVCLVLSSAGVAEGRSGPKSAKTPIDEFMRMSPAQQQKALNRLPPEQRRRLEERLEKFNQLPRGQQQTLRNMYDRLNQLPPERQQAVRRSLNQFSQQPPERRQAMRQELRSMAPLGAQDRDGRMTSPEFREKFTEKEQRIVRDMSGLLPAR
jgi:t-SNARE complex subunit (syntaxin)